MVNCKDKRSPGKGAAVPNLHRRAFLKAAAAQCALTGALTGAFAVAGCTEEKVIHPRIVPLVELEQLKEGITSFPVQRVRIVREGNKVGAMSLNCTHLSCIVRESSVGLQCACHGSLFSEVGHVMQGPATKDLPWYRVSVTADKKIAVDLSDSVTKEWRLDLGAS